MYQKTRYAEPAGQFVGGQILEDRLRIMSEAGPGSAASAAEHSNIDPTG